MKKALPDSPESLLPKLTASLLGARDSGRASLSKPTKIAPLEQRAPSNEAGKVMPTF
jgi:hypothetical protein